MIINKTLKNGCLTIAPEGRLDIVSAPQFEKEVSGSLDGVTELVLDFEKVEYISSAGLRSLLIVYKLMHGHGNMKIRNACDLVQEVFEVTGFARIFTIE